MEVIYHGSLYQIWMEWVKECRNIYEILWVSIWIVHWHWKLEQCGCNCCCCNCPFAQYLRRTRCKWTLVDVAGWNDVPQCQHDQDLTWCELVWGTWFLLCFMGFCQFLQNLWFLGWNRVLFQSLALRIKRGNRKYLICSWCSPSKPPFAQDLHGIFQLAMFDFQKIYPIILVGSNYPLVV